MSNTATSGTRDGTGRHGASMALPSHTKRPSEHKARIAFNYMPATSQYSPIEPTSTPEPTRRSEMDIFNDLLLQLEQLSGHEPQDLVRIYENAALLPPITHESLAELDIARIINNPKLRHDVNFDRELHFRPNTDGPRGKQKQRSAEEYWTALAAELKLYLHIGKEILTCNNAADAEYWERMMLASQKRMPGIFETIKEVLKTLVPEKDQTRVMEKLDVPMIMQEIGKGVFDLMDLATWLAKLLKDHCAPMRDEWIDQMVTKTQQGVQEGSQQRIVGGLKELLGILEAMKLVRSEIPPESDHMLISSSQDVANHQIRHLRGLLIEDTVNFQQRYHLHRMTYGRLNISRSLRWFEQETVLLQHKCTSPDQIFTTALLRLLLGDRPVNRFYETFQLDAERLKSLRTDLHNHIHLLICGDVFAASLVPNQTSPQLLAQAQHQLRATLTDIVGESRRFEASLGNIAVEIVRLALQLSGEQDCYNADMVEHAERQLRVDLSVGSMAFRNHANRLVETLGPQLCDSVRQNLKLSVMALHETMMPPVATPLFGLVGAGPVPVKEDQGPLDDVCRRITHLAVLHWHIWSPLVYCAELQQQQDALACDEADPAKRSATNSPVQSENVAHTHTAISVAGVQS